LTPDTSLGFSCVEFAGKVIGISLFPWQRWLLIHALELLPARRFRFRTILVLVARQNGKTSLVEIKNLWKMFVLRVPLVINTAQNLDLSEESWDKAVEIVESIPELAAEMDGTPVRVNGKKTLKLLGGSRWKVATASRKGGRGLSGDDVNMDELREHHTWDSWGAVTKTTLARPKAQIWAYSNAGDDKSVVLNDLQAKGRAGDDRSESGDLTLGFFEWSAPDGCMTDDERFWPLANPSLGYEGGVGIEALRSALATDPEPVFRTECLCQRVPLLEPRPIDPVDWAACAVAQPVKPERPVFFLDCSPGLGSASICAAGSVGGKPHLELADYRTSADWLVARAAELAARYPNARFAVFANGAVSALLPALDVAGVKPEQFTGPEMGRACGHLQKLVVDRAVTHSGDALFAQALACAVRRDIGDDLWTWSRRKSGDISPLVSATGAAWLLETSPSYDVLKSVY